jgi:hypothetical protein
LWAVGFRLLTLPLPFGLRLGSAARCKFLLLACLCFTPAFLPDQFPALLLTALLSFSLLLRLDRAALILRRCECQHRYGNSES